MKKKLYIGMLLLFSNPVFAQDLVFHFIGASVSSKFSEFSVGTTRNNTTFGLRYGIQNTKWRSFIGLEKDQRSYTEVTFETDYLFDTLRVKRTKLKPYIGTSIGYYDHKLNDNKYAIFGLHSGLIVNLTETMDLDLSLSHKIKRETKNLKKLDAITLSLHYFF